MQRIDEQLIYEAIQPYASALACWTHHRHRVTREIRWFIDPDCWGAACLPQEAGYYHIRLRESPTTIEDAATICHELTHAVLYGEHFPSVGVPVGTPEIHQRVASLCNICLDLEVDRRLALFGFVDDLVTVATLPSMIARYGFASAGWTARVTRFARLLGFDTPAKMQRLMHEVVAMTRPNEYLSINITEDVWQSLSHRQATARASL